MSKDGRCRPRHNVGRPTGSDPVRGGGTPHRTGWRRCRGCRRRPIASASGCKWPLRTAVPTGCVPGCSRGIPAEASHRVRGAEVRSTDDRQPTGIGTASLGRREGVRCARCRVLRQTLVRPSMRAWCNGRPFSFRKHRYREWCAGGSVCRALTATMRPDRIRPRCTPDGVSRSGRRSVWFWWGNRPHSTRQSAGRIARRSRAGALPVSLPCGRQTRNQAQCTGTSRERGAGLHVRRTNGCRSSRHVRTACHRGSCLSRSSGRCAPCTVAVRGRTSAYRTHQRGRAHGGANTQASDQHLSSASSGAERSAPQRRPVRSRT